MTKSNDAFRTISEVAKELGLATHVLRFWESKFPQIKPLKRAGGRRYYRPDDVALLRRLQSLLHDEGYTIKGVQKLFREEGARKFIDEGTSQSHNEQDSFTSENPPQASLFDATPKQDPVQAAEDNLVTQSVPAEESFTYSPDLLPNAPEPEPIFSPDASQASVTPEEQPVIKQGLSEEQKTALQGILGELKDLKTLIDNVA